MKLVWLKTTTLALKWEFLPFHGYREYAGHLLIKLGQLCYIAFMNVLTVFFVAFTTRWYEKTFKKSSGWGISGRVGPRFGLWCVHRRFVTFEATQLNGVLRLACSVTCFFDLWEYLSLEMLRHFKIDKGNCWDTFIESIAVEVSWANWDLTFMLG